MTAVKEFEDKVPCATDYVLKQLYQTIEALKANNFRAAVAHAADALVQVQNELDWCYRTDRCLPYMREFLIELSDSLVTTEKVIPSARSPQVAAIIDILRSTMQQIENLTKDAARWQAPDPIIDYLEKEHRARTYGYDTHEDPEDG